MSDPENLDELDEAVAAAVEKTVRSAGRALTSELGGESLVRFGLEGSTLHLFPRYETVEGRTRSVVASMRAGRDDASLPEQMSLRRGAGSPVDAKPNGAVSKGVRAIERSVEARAHARGSSTSDGLVRWLEKGLERARDSGSLRLPAGSLLELGADWLDNAAWYESLLRLNPGGPCATRLREAAAAVFIRDRVWAWRRGAGKATEDDLAFLREAPPVVRAAATWIDPRAVAVEEVLEWTARFLEDGDPVVRLVARATRIRCETLAGAECSGEVAEHRRGLARALGSTLPEVRQVAAWALQVEGIAGVAAGDDRELVAEALNASLADPDPVVRTAAALSLLRSAPELSPGLETRLEMLEADGSDAERALAVGIRAAAEPSGGPAHERLLAAAGRAEGALSADAVWLLGEMAPGCPAAVETLIRMMAIRPEVSKVLGQMGERSVRAATAILDSDDSRELEAAIDLLAEIGAPAESALSRLIELLHHPKGTVRGSAATALGAIGGGHDSVYTALQALAARENDPFPSQAASLALIHLGRKRGP